MLGSVRLLLVFILVAWGASVGASEVEIARVDFDLQNQDGAQDPWYQVAVTVSVAEGEEGPGANPRFANDIVVSVALATDLSRSGGKGYKFYAAKVDYPTLEVGQHVARFYLPPEIVKRDRVRGEAFAYEIELLSREGLEFSLVSRNLERSAALQAFRSQVAENASASGELRPQHETPFAWAFPRDTPTPRLISR